MLWLLNRCSSFTLCKLATICAEPLHFVWCLSSDTTRCAPHAGLRTASLTVCTMLALLSSMLSPLQPAWPVKAWCPSALSTPPSCSAATTRLYTTCRCRTCLVRIGLWQSFACCCSTMRSDDQLCITARSRSKQTCMGSCMKWWTSQITCSRHVSDGSSKN